jgi:norsolorinic acid ketoreductase
MSSNTVYFITGANRATGLGFGLVKAFASRPNTIVFATARNPSTATELTDLAKQNPNIHVLKLAVDSESDTKRVAAEVQRLTGGIDVVIANAGILNYTGSGLETPIAAVEEHFRINTLSPLILFQALYPLLKARQTRKFVVVSTQAASIKDIMPLAVTAYGASKAALNFITRRLHSEHLEEGFVIIPLNPGWVATDMGNAGAKSVGMEKAPLTVEQSVEGQVKVIDGAGKEESGRFWSFDGEELAW